MFIPTRVPPHLTEAFSRSETRLIREVMVKAAWVVMLVSALSNGTILIRGSSLIDLEPAWNYGLRIPPLVVCLLALALHYARAPGQLWPLVMLRVISLSAMWSVLGLLVFAYEQGGTAFRILSELSILSIFCATLVSLRGVRGCLFPLFVPLAGLTAVMLYRGHDPVDLALNLFSFISATGIALLVTHIQYRIRVSEFVSRQELNELSTVDSLTGVMNRRAMTERLEAERARHHRLSHSLAIILLDLDHFRRINDQVGHKAGDRVLQQVASRLKSHTRQQDCLARWGGEEFLILLPETDEIGAMGAAEKLRKALGEPPFETGGKNADVTLTGSFGVAIYDGREPSSRLVARAAQALYMARECGRNRTVMA